MNNQGDPLWMQILVFLAGCFFALAALLATIDPVDLPFKQKFGAQIVHLLEPVTSTFASVQTYAAEAHK